MNVKVLVDGKAVEVGLERAGDKWLFTSGGEPLTADAIEIEPGVWSVLIDGRSVEVRVAGDRFHVRGRELEVRVDDPRDASTSSSSAGVQGRQTIVSPMPGKVVRILVKKGDSVERNQGVLVMEAMKMQNELKSPVSGIVQSVDVSEGATVPAGQVLAVIE